MVWERGWRAVWTEKGRRRVQYSERPFPVFVLTSSLISVMQKNWSEERKMKAPASKRSVQNRTEQDENVDFISYVVYLVQVANLRLWYMWNIF